VCAAEWRRRVTEIAGDCREGVVRVSRRGRERAARQHTGVAVCSAAKPVREGVLHDVVLRRGIEPFFLTSPWRGEDGAPLLSPAHHVERCIGYDARG
jgi:hypothetical protein